MYSQNLFQAGNSQVVAIPRELFDDMGFQKGQKVFVDKANDDTIIIKKPSRTAKPKSEADFQKWLKVFLAENSEILDELADR